MIKVLDLFAGAGGFELGLRDEGLVTKYAIEQDRFCCETLRENFPELNVIEKSVTEISDKEIRKKFSDVDVIVGGPPCQGFSVAGPSQYGKIDKRNNLIFEMLRYMYIIQPKLCVIENVKGILSGKIKKGVSVIDEVYKDLEKNGYYCKHFVLQAANFGVPQWRERVFFFISKNKDYLPEVINGTHGKENWVSVGEAISDLPYIEAGEATEELSKYPQKAMNKYQKLMRRKSKGITNHEAMKHTKRLIERFKLIPVGGSLVDVPTEHGQRVRNGTEMDKKKRFKMNNQRLDPKKFSTAITASFQSNFVHPELHRNLTAREGARLQSFPDRHKFIGPRTLMSKKLLIREGRHDEIGLSQYNQIGNAVPPLLAKGVAKAIKEAIIFGDLDVKPKKRKKKVFDYEQGTLF